MTMPKLHLYAVSYEDNEGGGIHKVTNSFPEAVYQAAALFGQLLPYEDNPARFLEVCADPETIVRVDVFECDSWDEADEQFADALFTPLFHLDNGMDFTD